MIAAEIIGQVLHAGGQIEVDGADLVLDSDPPVVRRPSGQAQSPQARSFWRRSGIPTTSPLWWRVAIREPDGQTIEVDTPSGWTLPDWQAYAERYHGTLGAP